MILPGSWAGVLELFRPVFARRGTFVLFTVLATGLVASTGRRSVVGMLAGARMAQQISFHAACRFFSAAVWDVDRMGLIVARLVVSRLLGPGEPVTVVIDDTLFKRWGRHVWHAHWTHDGAAQGGKKIARGNRWVVAGIVVRLPLCTAPVCLPVLMRLWAGKGTTTPVELAAQLLKLIVAEFPDRDVHGVGDAAYHGTPLQVPGATWTTRLPANACLFDTAPPRTGRRGRPALKGRKLGRPAALATDADAACAVSSDAGWRTASVYRYGRTETVQLAERACIWYGSFGNTPGRCVQVRELGSSKAYDLALFTLDQTATPEQIVERYAIRWSIEPANAVGKQQMGVGQARNRVRKAVERTVPFGMLIQSLVVVWYALHGHHPDDALARRLAQPWYQSKTEPSFEDMIVKLRKTLIVARFSPVSPGQPNPDLLHDYALACAAAAA
jgi:DDE superfamily endonuclease